MSDHDSDASSDALDPEEPHTPFWLSMLGGALFLFGAIFLLATADEEAQAEQVEEAEENAEATATDD